MTHRRNRLTNGRFLQDLDNWDPSSASYKASDGDEQYGIAEISDGGSIEQEFSVPRARSYTLHVALKSVGSTVTGSDVTATLTDDAGNTVTTINLTTSSADTWEESENTLGLAQGTTYTLTIANSSGNTIRVDDVWLWHVPITRSDAADRVDRKLGRLASNRSLSTATSGSQTEGDYTDAVDAGLRDVGAIHFETGRPDVRYIDPDDVEAFVEAVEHAMLERLHRDYSADVDASFAGQSLKRSQRAQRIGETLEQRKTSDRRPKVRRLHHD